MIEDFTEKWEILKKSIVKGKNLILWDYMNDGNCRNSLKLNNIKYII